MTTFAFVVTLWTGTRFDVYVMDSGLSPSDCGARAAAFLAAHPETTATLACEVEQ